MNELLKCLRCHQWWMTNSGPHNILLRRYCPICIPKISHPLTYDPPGRCA